MSVSSQNADLDDTREGFEHLSAWLTSSSHLGPLRWEATSSPLSGMEPPNKPNHETPAGDSRSSFAVQVPASSSPASTPQLRQWSDRSREETRERAVFLALKEYYIVR
uniref:Uncharacterized protein n=1 Tax=Tetraselmis sp. GSL018 TaxID=582737 RepID=A0A061RA21_9CHLO